MYRTSDYAQVLGAEHDDTHILVEVLDEGEPITYFIPWRVRTEGDHYIFIDIDDTDWGSVTESGDNAENIPRAVIDEAREYASNTDRFVDSLTTADT